MERTPWSGPRGANPVEQSSWSKPPWSDPRGAPTDQSLTCGIVTDSVTSLLPDTALLLATATGVPVVLSMMTTDAVAAPPVMGTATLMVRGLPALSVVTVGCCVTCGGMMF